MTHNRLIYGFDPICGWCYGFIPTLRNFAKNNPNVEIEVVLGGLFTDQLDRPYTSLVEHITKNFPIVTAATGQAPSDAFWAHIKDTTSIVASEPPTHAVLQVKELEPQRAVDFAHLLQEAHFQKGQSFNDAKTYDEISKNHGFPKLDTDAILGASTRDPLVAQSIMRFRSFGMQSFPTTLVVTEDDVVLGRVQGVYDPQAFETKVKQLFAGNAG